MFWAIFTLGWYGHLERTDFGLFLLWKGVSAGSDALMPMLVMML